MYNDSMNLRSGRHWWARTVTQKKKGIFGGEMKSHKEVRTLNQKITRKEQEEFEEFEKVFNQRSSRIWKEK